MRVVDLKALSRERGLRGYSRLRKAELIALLQNNPPPPPPPAPCTRPPKPTWPPPPPPPQARRALKAEAQLVRFRPDRPRQPELMRQLEERNPEPLKPSTLLASPVAGRSGPRTSSPTCKPYQLKPKRGKETFMEPPMEQKELPPPDAKKLKLMKKKLNELNRKISHCRKKHDGMIHKQNSLRKAIEGLKHGTKPEVLGPRMAEPVPEPDWTLEECEQAFGGAYRSYRVNGRPKMDVDTFFSRTRGDLIDFLTRAK